MSVDPNEAPGGDMGAAMRLAKGLRGGGDNGGGEYADITGLAHSFVARVVAERISEARAAVASLPASPDVPAHIRSEAWRLAGQNAPGATLCQRIQNADLIAQWLYAGRVPQV